MIVLIEQLSNELKMYTGRIRVYVHDREDEEKVGRFLVNRPPVEVLLGPDRVEKGFAYITGTQA